MVHPRVGQGQYFACKMELEPGAAQSTRLGTGQRAARVGRRRGPRSLSTAMGAPAEAGATYLTQTCVWSVAC